ncbi:hypothetical protein BGX28_004390 [Mortierella sp. GBA30]|nr:hypothetical protein BGX28_004390 [Mortierella sp. GBA30]
MGKVPAKSRGGICPLCSTAEKAWNVKSFNLSFDRAFMMCENPEASITIVVSLCEYPFHSEDLMKTSFRRNMKASKASAETPSSSTSTSASTAASATNAASASLSTTSSSTSSSIEPSTSVIPLVQTAVSATPDTEQKDALTEIKKLAEIKNQGEKSKNKPIALSSSVLSASSVSPLKRKENSMFKDASEVKRLKYPMEDLPLPTQLLTTPWGSSSIPSSPTISPHLTFEHSPSASPPLGQLTDFNAARGDMWSIPPTPADNQALLGMDHSSAFSTQFMSHDAPSLEDDLHKMLFGDIPDSDHAILSSQPSFGHLDAGDDLDRLLMDQIDQN